MTNSLGPALLTRIGSSVRPSRRHYESDVYVPSRPTSSFKRPGAASAYSLESSAKRSAFFGAGDYTAPLTRPAHFDKPAERSVLAVP